MQTQDFYSGSEIEFLWFFTPVSPDREWAVGQDCDVVGCRDADGALHTSEVEA